MKKIFFLLINFLVLQVFIVSAQTPTATPPRKDDVVVINTSLIQIDVTVTDKDGKAVTDLKKEDFEIYENNKLQPVTNFSFVAAQSKTSAEQVTNKQSSTEKQTTVSPPAVPNNLRPEQVRRTIALVVDDLGLSFASMEWTKKALRKFVDEQIQPGEMVAVVRTSSGIGVLQQFTTDKRLLHAAIDRIRWNVGRGGVGTFSPIEPNHSEILSGVIAVVPKDDGGYQTIEKNVAANVEERQSRLDAQENQEGMFTAGTLGAVNFVMRGMGQMPGRKAVVLFSDGFKLFSRKGMNARVQQGVQKMVDAANRSGVIIYTMDARGLDVPLLSAEDNTYGIEPETVTSLIKQRNVDLLDTQQSLRYIAEQTGGFAIINQNNLSKGIERILDDQKRYYLIGYEPDDEVFDIEKRRFNKITVKVKRPGLTVRYRSGFFGITDSEAKPQPKTAVQQLISSLTSPFSSNEIDLRLTSIFAGDSSSGTFMRSLIYIKAGDFKFKEQPDGWYKAEFDISALTFGDNGEVIDQVNSKQTVKAPAKSLQSLYKEGLVCAVTLPIQKPGAYQMRVAIRDAETGHIGSASQYIEVPNLKKKNLVLSGIVLENVQEDKNNSTADSKSIEIKLQRDAAMRRFHNGEFIRFGFSIYNANTDKANGNKPNLTMQYKIFRDGKEIFASQERPLTINPQPNYQVIDTSGAFFTGNNLQHGDYVIQVIVKDLLAKKERQMTTQWTDFEIVP